MLSRRFLAKKEGGSPPHSQRWLACFIPTSLKLKPLISIISTRPARDSDEWAIKDGEALPKIKNLYQTKGVSVVVSKGECRLLVIRRLAEQGISLPKVQVEEGTIDLPELNDFGCPAIRRVDGKYHIDETVCWSCYFCPQIYSEKIKIKIKKK